MSAPTDTQIWREVRETAAIRGWDDETNVKVMALQQLCKQHAIVNAAARSDLRTQIDRLWIKNLEPTVPN